MRRRWIYVQMELNTVLYKDITSSNNKPHQSEMVAPDC